MVMQRRATYTAGTAWRWCGEGAPLLHGAGHAGRDFEALLLNLRCETQERGVNCLLSQATTHMAWQSSLAHTISLVRRAGQGKGRLLAVKTVQIE